MYNTLICTFSFLQKGEATAEAGPDKGQCRYNLRRRKDDADAKPAAAKPEQLVEEDAKPAAAPGAPTTTPLDFGGKIGRLCDGCPMQLDVSRQQEFSFHVYNCPLLAVHGSFWPVHARKH